MQQLIQVLSEILGLDYGVVEGSVATLAFLFAGFLLKLLWAASKRDDKQVDLENTLASLAVTAVQSYQENTKVMKEIMTTLENMKVGFSEIVLELRSVVGGVDNLVKIEEKASDVREDIKKNLIKTSKTTVIVKDNEDNVWARFTAEPDGEGNLVVRFGDTLAEKI